MGFKRDIEYATNEAYKYFNKVKVIPDREDIQGYVVDWLCHKFDMDYGEAVKVYLRNTQ